MNTDKNVLEIIQLTVKAEISVTVHCSANLLQSCGAQLDGDVGEEVVSLCAEVSDDVGVRVGLSQELHLSLCHLETLWQNSLHGNEAVVKFTPKIPITWLCVRVLFKKISMFSCYRE